MITIYHNPRCRKSREGLQILEESGAPFKIVKYLDTPLNVKDLQEILKILNIQPLDLIRKGESVWKEQYKGKNLDDLMIISAMVMHPKLIERPIVINGEKGIIGRPPVNIKSIL